MVKNNTDNNGGGNIFVVIVAAGSGTRFGADMPKQFLPLAGKPVLMHTVEAFRNALPEAEIILVLSATGMEIWEELCREHGFDSPAVVEGGSSRSESVSRALDAIASAEGSANAIVLVHDGARPLAHPLMVRRVADAVRRPGIEAAMPVLPLTDALASDDGDFCIPADRAAFCAAQTPQAFRFGMLREAYARAAGKAMADDAAIAATYAGARILKVPGYAQNIKITHPSDIAIAEIYLANPAPYKG